MYWSSPRGRTATVPVSSLAVATCWQALAVPVPPLQLASVGSQAISPAARTTGSLPPVAVGVGVLLALLVAVGDGAVVVDVAVGVGARLALLTVTLSTTWVKVWATTLLPICTVATPAAPRLAVVVW